MRKNLSRISWIISLASIAGLAWPRLILAADGEPFVPTIHPISGSGASVSSVAPPVAGQPADPTLQQLGAWFQRSVQSIRTAQLGPVSSSSPATERASQAARVRGAWERLRRTTDPAVEVRFRPESGAAMQVMGRLAVPSSRGTAGTAAVAPPRDAAEATVRSFLREYRDLFLLEDPARELKLIGQEQDEQGFKTLRFAQQSGDRPVWPAEMVTRLDAAGDLYLVEATHVPTPRRIPSDPRIDGAEAVERVRRGNPALALGTATDPTLIIYAPLDKVPRLAWKFELTVGLLNAWTWIVDADNGTVLTQTSLVLDAAVKGSGKDVTGITRELDLWKEGNTYYLVNASKAMFDPTSSPPNNGRGVISIYDGGNKVVESPDFSSGLVSSSSPTTGWLPDAVGSAWGLSFTFDYFSERFGRNSLDGSGGKISSIVRYDLNLPNAFWNGQTKTMVFGDSETKFIEVTGHELTHGVSGSIGNGGILEYQFQSGALNESMSDIFGNLVKLYATGAQDWKIRLFNNGQDEVIRDFKNPNSVVNGGIALPKNMSQYARLTLDQDKGGVHINSSINNHAFYLLAEGLPDAIGLSDAEKIFYRALTQHLQKQSQFIDMRLAAVAAAKEIFGADSKQVSKVKEAYDGVEIFDAPDSPVPTPIPSINAPDSTLFLSVDSFTGDVLLGRRELLFNDPIEGRALNTLVPLAGQRISVSGDGSLAAFVTFDNDVGIIATDGSYLDFANLAGAIHSVAMSPDATRFSVVLNDLQTGQPYNQMAVVDLSTSQTQSIKLYSPTQDGKVLDIIQFADSMTFVPSGQAVIYDAFAELPQANGRAFSGWSLYALDLVHNQITGIIDLNEGFDFGNPSLGKTRNNLLTFEVVDKKTGVSTVFATDLNTGDVKPIAQLAQAGIYGLPTYSGDDRAIIYSQVDLSTATTISLLRQPLAADGISPVGNPTLWISDADFGTVYRRGEFRSQNAAPTVKIASPVAGQTYSLPASIQVAVTASDPDSGVAKVGLYLGSTLLAESQQAPYNFTLTVDSAPTGTLRLVARATDTLGAETDSAPLELKFAVAPPANRGRLVASLAGTTLQLKISGLVNGDRVRVQSSEDLKTWLKVTDLVAAGTEATFQEAAPKTIPRRYFRTILNP